MKFVQIIIASLMLGVWVSAYAEQSSTTTPGALEDVRNTLNQVVEIAVEFRGESNAALRREKLRTTVNKSFDFREMARRSLGAHWDKITPAQQQEFVTLFSDLLSRTYLNRVETVERNMVFVDSERLDYPRTVVRTTVNNKGDKFPIDYKLQFDNGSWKVYDVVIENIGLVANYRNEFSGIIRKEQFDGLIKRLKEKVGAA